MKLFSSSVTRWIAFILFCTGTVMSQSSYDLRSPDNRVEIRIRTTDRVKYDVLYKGTALLQDCTLSLNVEHQVLGMSPKVVSRRRVHMIRSRCQWSARSLQKFATITTSCG